MSGEGGGGGGEGIIVLGGQGTLYRGAGLHCAGGQGTLCILPGGKQPPNNPVPVSTMEKGYPDFSLVGG